MAGDQRLQHVGDLCAAHLAHDDPVGAHPKGLTDQGGHVDGAATLNRRRASFEPHQMRGCRAQFRAVLDQHNPVVGGDIADQSLEQCGLTGSRSAADNDGVPAGDCRLQDLGCRIGDRPGLEQLVPRDRSGIEPA